MDFTFTGEPDPKLEEALGEYFVTWLPESRELVIVFINGIEVTVTAGSRLVIDPGGAIAVFPPA